MAISEEIKHNIVQQLAQDCTIKGIVTDLAIKAKEQQVKTEVLDNYQPFSKLFSEKVL